MVSKQTAAAKALIAQQEQLKINEFSDYYRNILDAPMEKFWAWIPSLLNPSAQDYDIGINICRNFLDLMDIYDKLVPIFQGYELNNLAALLADTRRDVEGAIGKLEETKNLAPDVPIVEYESPDFIPKDPMADRKKVEAVLAGIRDLTQKGVPYETAHLVLSPILPRPR